MKNGILIAICFLLIFSAANAQADFDQHFENKTMRVDLVLAGNNNSQSAYLLEIQQEPYWGGSVVNLIDKLGYGEYRFSVSDSETKKLVYSRGFCTLFEEWRTTEEAKGLNKAFYQTVTFPFPKNKVDFVLEERKKDGSYAALLTMKIDPEDSNIRKEALPAYEVSKVINNGDAADKVDLTFIAEGYTKYEMDKFKKDVKRMADYVLSFEPFNQHKHKFNVWAVCSPSDDAGTDNPRKKQWARTAVNSMFNTFYIDRYLETSDVISIRDIAACAPYDHICVLVNTDKYGGGGIYNHFSIGTSNHPMANQVMLHELGHGLIGLADEYYTSDVAYQNFFDLNVEPWQPNITTMVNFDKKWKHLIDKDTPVPTPDTPAFHQVTGVFEGGGYVAKGVYRPAVNCRMKSNHANGFCAACQEAIVEMITFLTH